MNINPLLHKMNTPTGRRLRHQTMRVFALGTAICGAAITYSGWNLHAVWSGSYKKNLDALAVTIGQLNQTCNGLKRDFGSFNHYLGTLRASLKSTETDIGNLNDETAKFIKLAGTTAPEVLGESAGVIREAAVALKDTANQAGSIPTDPLAAQRESMYKISSSLRSMGDTLGNASSDIARLAIEIGETTGSSLKTAKSTLESTEKQIRILEEGSLRQVPEVMEALSAQLGAHLQLVESSYGLLNRVSVLVILVGAGFFFAGLWGLLLPNPGWQGAASPSAEGGES